MLMLIILIRREHDVQIEGLKFKLSTSCRLLALLHNLHAQALYAYSFMIDGK